MASAPRTLPFGKHKGRDFPYVFENDIGYTKWAAIFARSDGELAAFGAAAREHLDNMGGAVQVGFGKFAGLTYEELFQAEPKYCGWVRETVLKRPRGLKNAKMHHFVRWMSTRPGSVEGACTQGTRTNSASEGDAGLGAAARGNENLTPV